MTSPWRPVSEADAAFIVAGARRASIEELEREVVRLGREQRAACARHAYADAARLGFRATVLRQEIARRQREDGPRAA